MSRFADPTAIETVPLGACQCPGTPHERDEAVVRWDLGASALMRIGQAQMGRGADFYAPYRALILEAVVSWNLQVLHNGEPVTVPLAAATIAELDESTLDTLGEAIDALIENKGKLPNPSGASSPASSRGSASRTPTKRPKPGT